MNTEQTSNLFQDEKIRPELRTGLKKIDFKNPTEVQGAVIPKLLIGDNVVVQAATGSGKTHAYLIPILNMIDEQAPVTQAVVTAPSRELANQLYKVARQLRDAAGLDISIEYLGGGNDRSRQIAKAENRAPQLIIATPGRLHDFVSKKVISLEKVKAFVIDEADMTLDMGFLQNMDEVMSKLPKDAILSAFSATIPVKLENFLRKYMTKPEFIVIDNPAVIAPTIQNDLIDVGSKDKKELLYKLLTMGQPYLALVFANTKKTVDDLAAYLENQGLKVAKIHGGITERERKRIIRQVREGQYQYVVASDLAARGIDVPGVSLVINYEIPKELEFVIHRIGRTGRNNLPGHAITLIYDDEMADVEDLEKLGIHFDFKELKNGELVERTHHHRRENRRVRNHKLDNRMVGMVKKAKKKRKPGYKKKIQEAIKKDRQQKRKLEERHLVRKAKRKRKREREQARNNFEN
ncbi:DEAD/DEAH box helicase [Lactobacillus sp. PV012]|uniref:DEAD/DEAH box helicase n=1 Tax=Lactobacillus sp. PV012 TaxID=2594494 RepID=UPI00223F593B|nr:DEAD/DEAH box helicase [Lactobacillus sp. PV012]QNQ81909.1 DEAD/DEAH box helicase [Lactobacillus sp. PV012]